MKPLTVIFIGPQGSGKGTQARILSHDMGAEFIEMGAVLREVTEQDTEFGRHVKGLIDNGFYVTDEDAERVLSEKLATLDLSRDIVFDGIPRRLGQAHFMIDRLKELGLLENTHTIYMNLPREESVRRLSGRRICKNCDAIVSIYDHEDIKNCLECGGELVQRADDTPEFINRRLDQYHELTVPVLDYLESVTTFHRVDAMQSIEKVTADIESVLGVTKHD
jgi:adenylate kinase